ncbi:serine hydrolase [Flavobacteriaceae bacterium TP-CH-4]|uniref:Serine hydrolase n=1 Tax=Pelagihabitans pacificus TaxID=2696054 RepID=A0A967E483_9FLAO|nr:serine hydrolase [Pelagihabitans pacificus]NHF58127.1 serine hydrolase [Pelagihabitans pacificus]
MNGRISLVCLLLWCSSCTENPKKMAVSDSPETRFESLEKKVIDWQQELHIPHAGIGIIEEGEIVFSKVLSPRDSTPNQQLLFNIASITKVVFGTTVMKLVDRGQWDLDAPLYPYHVDEDVKDDPRHKELTSRDVLSQRSGFVNWRWNHPTGKLTFDFDPGTTFNYSGEGMEYLRQAIEKRYGTVIDTLADTLLFKPASMPDTRHSWDGTANWDRFSRFYDAQGKEHVLDDYSFEGQAADDIMTTVDDLTNFGRYVLNGAGLRPEIFEKMVTAQTAINDNQDQALAWRLIRNLPNGEYAIHHGGNDIGVATLLVLLPKSKRGIVVMTNSDAGLVLCNNVVREVWGEGTEIIHRAYRSGSMDEIPKAVPVEAELLLTYEGVYEQPSGRKVTISAKEQSLLMEMPGVPNFQLYPQSDTEFFLKDFDPIIAFSKSEEGDPVLEIIEGENTIVCKKIE